MKDEAETTSRKQVAQASLETVAALGKERTVLEILDRCHSISYERLMKIGKRRMS
jgi:hypothetical protein